MMKTKAAKFGLGQSVRQLDDAFSGVILDVDASYDGPVGETGALSTDQPFYKVLVIEESSGILVYAAEQSLMAGPDPEHAALPHLKRWFRHDDQGRLQPRFVDLH
jgi:heat shock protein HspQ